jgi:hypothetical protein
MKEIPLTKGKFALVDDSDYPYFIQFKYFYNGGYAARVLPRDGKKQKQVKMHNEIMNPPPGFQVDHVDGNRLNNQRSNLRNCTQTQNNRNRSMSRNNTSGYRGVCWNCGRGMWQATIRVLEKREFLGYFPVPEDAARVWDKAAIKYRGEFARLNFPDEAQP